MRNGHSVNLYAMAGPGDLNDNRRPLDRDAAERIAKEMEKANPSKLMDYLNDFQSLNEGQLRTMTAREYLDESHEYVIAQLIAESNP